MTKMHHYFLTRGFLIHVRESPLNLAWLLWQRGAGLGFEDRLYHPRLRFTPPLLLKGYRIARLVLALSMYQLGVKQTTITLSGYGQLGLALRLGGYKLFDLRASSVLTLFSQALKEDVVAAQIIRARRAGQHQFAPSVTASNVAERWYQERYVSGQRLPPLLLGPDQLETCFFPLFLVLLKAEPVQTLDVGHYARQLRDAVLGETRGLAHPDLGLSTHQTSSVREFVERVSTQIGQLGQVDLVLSHGDLHEQNVLATGNSFTLIDWNNLGYRTVVYDLYTLLFRNYYPVRAFWSAQLPPAQPEAIAQAVSDFKDWLLPELPQMAAHVDQPVYRHFFYLEFLCKGMDKIWEKPSPEVAQTRLEQLTAWVNIFQRYEASFLE